MWEREGATHVGEIVHGREKAKQAMGFSSLIYSFVSK